MNGASHGSPFLQPAEAPVSGRRGSGAAACALHMPAAHGAELHLKSKEQENLSVSGRCALRLWHFSFCLVLSPHRLKLWWDHTRAYL